MRRFAPEIRSSPSSSFFPRNGGRGEDGGRDVGMEEGAGGRGEEKGSERVGWKVRNERAGNKRGE